MTSHRQQQFDDALDRIEEALLPDISMVLDALIDAAGRHDGQAATAMRLAAIGRQIELLTCQVQSIEGLFSPPVSAKEPTRAKKAGAPGRP